MRRTMKKSAAADSRTVNVTFDAKLLARAEAIARTRGVKVTEWFRRVIGEEVVRIETREQRGAA